MYNLKIRTQTMVDSVDTICVRTLTRLVGATGLKLLKRHRKMTSYILLILFMYVTECVGMHLCTEGHLMGLEHMTSISLV